MKKVLSLLTVVIMLAALALSAGAINFNQANQVEPSPLSATLYAGITYDTLTDSVMYSNKADDTIPVTGGLVRLMVAVIAENTRQNNANAFSSINEDEYETTLANLLLGESDASAERIALLISNSTIDFIDLMNATAARLGMEHTKYTNVKGTSDNNATTTVYDTLLLAKEAYKYSNIKSMLKSNSYTSMDGDGVFTRKNTFSIIDSSNKSYNKYINFFISSPFDEDDGFLAIAGVNSLTGREVIMIIYESEASKTDYINNYAEDITKLQRNAINNYYQTDLANVAKSIAKNLTYTLADGTTIYVAAEIPTDEESLKLFSNDYGIILSDIHDNCYIDVDPAQLPASAELGKTLITTKLKYNNDELITVRLRTTKIQLVNGTIHSEDYILYDVDDGAAQADAQYNRNGWIVVVGIVVIISISAVLISEFVKNKFIT